MKSNKEKEIFRYSDGSEDFIGTVLDIRDQLEEDFFHERKSPFKNIDSPVYWISICRTNRTAKKLPNYKINRDDALCAKGDGKKIKQAWDIIELVSKWIEKESPTFLAISPYEDSSYKKRLHFYNRFFLKRNYKIIYVSYDYYTAPLVIYAKEGLNIKYPNIKLNFDSI